MALGAAANEGVVVLPVADAPLLVSDFTMECWFRLDVEEYTYLIDTRGANDSDGACLIVWPENGLCAGIKLQTGEAWAECHQVTLGKGTWHHAAVARQDATLHFYLDGQRVTAPTVNPWPTNTSQAALAGSFHLLSTAGSYIGCSNTKSAVLDGALDEVLIHKVAKSPEYIYRRANPGVPMVRFLASTEAEANAGKTFDWYEYALHWGDKTATQRPPLLAGLSPDQKCYGLLSPCLGYAGWWRFNEGSGTVAVDSSTLKRMGARDGAEYAAGAEGTCLSFDGKDDRVFFVGTQQFSFPEPEIQVEALLGTTQNQQTGPLLYHRVGGSEPGYFFYTSSGKLRAFVDPSGPWNSTGVLGQAAVNDGTWKHGAFSFSSGKYQLWRDWAVDGTGDEGTGGPKGDAPACIGCSWDGFFSGLIDSVRLMSRALTSDEFLHYPMAGWEWGDGNWTLD